MPTEQRVIASKPKIGARPTGGAPPEPAAEEAPAKSKKKLIIILAAVLVLGGGGAYWFLMGPGAGDATAEEGHAEEKEHKPEPGEILAVEPVSINLAKGHYLRLGMGLQMSADAGGHGKPSPAPALDLAIDLFSGRPMSEVASAEGREALKAELLTHLEEAYHGEVIDLYFTDYVTQ
ncbi:flagellar basal body-associated FliL family protein [Actinotalea sp. BY-33]|uniref:Flagellar protein FliL n=1 Tax=Actinotalea soli TaxID=2819234 RepID=A0A939RUF5_9CELL|nr:flagellar basal body-associated FliL family protein [Actinotalea soli]MBO1751270.1 flagellar basal body-associated FliL family protein [Actinotalea soli]